MSKMIKSGIWQKILLCISIALMLTACTADSHDQGQTETIEAKPSEADLRIRIEQFNEAFAKGEFEQISQMISATYIHTNGTSPAIDRATWLAYIENRQTSIQSGDLVIHAYSMEELKITYHSNAAIVTGKVLVSQSREGQKEENAYRITQLWLVEEGEWKRAGFHDGKIE